MSKFSAVMLDSQCQVMMIDWARRHMKRYAGPHGDLVNAHCLYRFDEPVSPHLAVNMAAEGRAGVGKPMSAPSRASS
jgi:hypothetical protein